jgi:hypothetical protein
MWAGNRKILKVMSHIIFISLGWVLITELNNTLFGQFAHSIRAHWIFLPAGFRPIIILLFGKVGAAGLVLGGYLTVMGTTGGDQVHAAVFAVILGSTPWLAVSLGRRLMAIPRDLSGLAPRHIIAICMLCSTFNAAFLNGYLWFAGRLVGGPIQIATVFVGDLFGSAIVMFLLSTVLALLMPRRS